MLERGIDHGGGVAEAAKRYGGALPDWLDLSTGINPVPPALPAVSADAWTRLPGLEAFREASDAARAFYGARAARPLPVPGIQSAIQRLPELVAGEGRAAVLAPTYGEYGLVLRRAGIGVDEVGALAEIGPQHRLAVVVNPNNPDGRTVRRGELLALAEDIGRRGGHLVVDEAFADADPDESVAGEAGRAEGLVVFRSFGKFFGLAGMRLGFVLATETVRARFERALGPWAVAGPALAVSTPLMRDASVRRRLTASISERRAAMRAVLDGAGLAVIGGTSLFLLVRAGNAQSLHESLCRRHILVRKFDYAHDWLRIGLAPDAAGDDRLARALAAGPA